jgi:hypothetical protein
LGIIIISKKVAINHKHFFLLIPFHLESHDGTDRIRWTNWGLEALLLVSFLAILTKLLRTIIANPTAIICAQFALACRIPVTLLWFPILGVA